MRRALRTLKLKEFPYDWEVERPESTPSTDAKKPTKPE